MRKWWIKRSEEQFDHVSADVLEVAGGGALVFKRSVSGTGVVAALTPPVPVLIVAPGTYESVHLDEEDELLS